ncbi:hypothetical protein N480_04970 [Pseudoalteromonas luteoviolacea S2607]|nr:hypothetical protein N480_04970 [Pseudoalteromonas luteoviolacea S2607]
MHSTFIMLDIPASGTSLSAIFDILDTVETMKAAPSI